MNHTPLLSSAALAALALCARVARIACLALLLIGLSARPALADEIVRENGSDAGWVVYDRSPAGATVRSVTESTGQVIELSGAGFTNGYRLGSTRSNNGGWNETSRFHVSWRLRADDRFGIYIATDTANGFRYLQYDNRDTGASSLAGNYVRHGLGASANDGSWRRHARDLAADLAAAEPGNTLNAVHGFLVRGNVRLDDIVFSDSSLANTGTGDSGTEGNASGDTTGGTTGDSSGDTSGGTGTAADSRVRENGESGSAARWVVYDRSPSGASVRNVADATGAVIELSGAGFANGYRLGSTRSNNGGWNETTRFRASWRLRTSERFGIYIAADTANGFRYLQYDNRAAGAGSVAGNYVRYGLGASSTNGNWASYSRNLAADLADAEPGNTLVAVHGFLVRGNLRIDDIVFASVSASDDSSSDPTDPPNPTTDPSVDPPSDPDGASNVSAVMEDGEDGTVAGWVVYDSNPSGATISNVADATGQVIELAGAGFTNGYRLGGTRASNGGWNETARFKLSWRWRTSERFGIYVAADTRDGFRYFQYDDRPAGSDSVSGKYLRYGLGSTARNGSWQSISRNLVADLAALEPDNALLAVHGFLARGNLRLDDIVVSRAETTVETPPEPVVVPDPEPEPEPEPELEPELEPEPEPVPVAASVPDLSGYELVFNDEFSGSTLDPDKWHTNLLWGPYWAINREEQLYVDTLHMHSNLAGTASDPFELTGSTLKINATPTSDSLPPPPRPPRDSPLYKRDASTYRYGDADGTPGTPGYRPPYDPDNVNYLSGIITSYESFKMTHGYVEARAKLPAGRGLWPAFWMLPTHYVEAVPEIDVMEFLGQDVDRLYNTYHFFDVPAGWQLRSTPSFPVYATDWTQDFHTFGMAWSPKKIVWYVDGVETHSITDETVHAASGAKFKIASQAMYLIANLAVGGSWPGAPDDTTPFPVTYEIDYIRAYKKKTADPIDLAADYQLMFGDEFNGSSLDPLKWESHFIWGPYLPINNEEQYYVDSLYSDADLGYSPFVFNQETIGGETVKYLSITARTATDPDGVEPPEALPDVNDPIWTEHKTFNQNASYAQQGYTSGILTSYQSFRFAKGYAEVRARVPKGDGLWPAFWLLNRYYISQQPEIDILEVRGRRPDQAVHNYHRYRPGGILDSDEYVTTYGTPDAGYSDGFHTFGARWQPGKIDWYVDGVLEHTYRGADVGYQLMYVLVNLAVGGGFDPGAPPNPEEFPKTFDIDYIRIYQEKDTP